MIHPSLRSLVAIVFGVGVAIGGRTASAAPHDATSTPTLVAQETAAPLPAPAASAPAPGESAAPAPAGSAAPAPAGSVAPAPAMSALPSPPPIVTPPPAEPTAQPQSFKLHGEADVGYTRVPSGGSLQFVNGGFDRTFDRFANSPNLGNVFLGATLNTAGLGGELDISLGDDADVIAPYETNNTPNGGPRNKGWDVTQAYLSHKCATGAWLAVGKFEKISGYENIEGSKDWNYSRSILFGFANPFTETGVRVGWSANETVKVTLGETLGWDQIRQTSNQGAATNFRTSEAALTYSPSANFSWKVDANLGKEQQAIQGPILSPINGLPLNGIRRLYDTVLSGHVTKNLSLAGNYDYGTQDNILMVNSGGAATGVGQARWQGGAAYANYQFTPKWSGTVRAELFRDLGGYRTGFDQKLAEQTITAQYQPSSPLMLRVEYRNDDSSEPVFQRNPNTPFASGAKFQHTLGAEVLAKF